MQRDPKKLLISIFLALLLVDTYLILFLMSAFQKGGSRLEAGGAGETRSDLPSGTQVNGFQVTREAPQPAGPWSNPNQPLVNLDSRSVMQAGALDSRVWLAILVSGYRPLVTTCFNRSGPVIEIAGEQSAQYHTRDNPLPDNGIVDARTAVWTHVHDYPVVLEGGPGICFSGGTVWGNYPYSTDWATMHDTTAFTFRTTGSTTVENIRVHNYGDGITFSTGNPSYSFHIIGARMTHIRDDCVQNDYMYAGLVEDSFFDGCYTAFSAQSHSSSGGNDGSQNVWTIKNSLIRLEPMEKVYNDKGLIPGHGPFFKWNSGDNNSPQLSLHDNVFRADQPSNNTHGLGLPEGKLASCSNNVVVWLGEGAYPDPLPSRFDGKPCFTITTDRAVWDNAVANWKGRH